MADRTPVGEMIHRIDEFFVLLKRSFPDNYILESQHDKFLLAKKVNPRLVATEFYAVLKPYSSVILSKDRSITENFFIGEEFTSSMIGKPEEKMFNEIKNLWFTGTSETTKDSIVKYFKLFVKIGEKL